MRQCGLVIFIVFTFVSKKISEKKNHLIACTLESSRKVSNSLCFSSVNTIKLVMLVFQAPVLLISVITIRWLYIQIPGSFDSVHLIWKKEEFTFNQTYFPCREMTHIEATSNTFLPTLVSS